MKLAKIKYTHEGKSITAHYRPGTSDEQALAEVIDRHVYRRVRDKFDVLPGEGWLDLGANIGAFAIYCQLRNAASYSYEPLPENVLILEKNVTSPVCSVVPAAVTASTEPYLDFKVSDNPENHYRGTCMLENVSVPMRYIEVPFRVPNTCISILARAHRYDGIKMDIEGSEHAILDDIDLLPRCDKLVLEYHTSRDSNVARLAQRLKNLKGRFNHVKYPKAYDDAIASGAENYRPRFDHLIFAWGPR